MINLFKKIHRQTKQGPLPCFVEETLGDIRFHRSLRHPLMSHEEIAFPLLAYNLHAKQPTQAGTFGSFKYGHTHEPNLLKNTSVEGIAYGQGVDRWRSNGFDRAMLFSSFDDKENIDSYLLEILAGFERSFLIFYEVSKSPIESGFIRRCKLVRHDMACKMWDLSKDNEIEMAQTVHASNFLRALWHEEDGRWTDCYGDTKNSYAFASRYGDYCEDATWECAVWEEEPGIVRGWTRPVYYPK